MNNQFESLKSEKFEKNCIDHSMQHKIAGGSINDKTHVEGHQNLDYTKYICTGDKCDVYSYDWRSRLTKRVISDISLPGKVYD